MTERNFTKGPILPAMLRFALPTLAGANLFLLGLATPITTALA